MRKGVYHSYLVCTTVKMAKNTKMAKIDYFENFGNLLDIFAMVQTRYEWYTPFLILYYIYIYLPIYIIIGVCNNHFRYDIKENVETLKMVNFGHFWEKWKKVNNEAKKHYMKENKMYLLCIFTLV